MIPLYSFLIWKKETIDSIPSNTYLGTQLGINIPLPPHGVGKEDQSITKVLLGVILTDDLKLLALAAYITPTVISALPFCFTMISVFLLILLLTKPKILFNSNSASGVQS